jgi:hypothetical protein
MEPPSMQAVRGALRLVGRWGLPSDRPTLSEGILASDPRFSANVSGQQEHSVLFQGFSWNGMSGGPVFAQAALGFRHDGNDRLPFQLAGVNFGHIGGLSGRSTTAEHSGWSGLFPSWLIREEIERQLSRVHE